MRINPPGHNHIWGTLGLIHGEPVFAIHTGRVFAAGFDSTSGFHVAIRSSRRDPNRNYTGVYEFITSRYLHLDRLAQGITPNINIAQGRRIGYVGNTGNTVGAGPSGRSEGHLHLEFNNEGVNFAAGSDRRINPQRFFEHIIFVGDTSRVLP